MGKKSALSLNRLMNHSKFFSFGVRIWVMLFFQPIKGVYLRRTKAFMNPLPGQMNLAWLDARIAQIEARVIAEKKQLVQRENEGLNTGQLCRQLAITTEVYCQ